MRAIPSINYDQGAAKLCIWRSDLTLGLPIGAFFTPSGGQAESVCDAIEDEGLVYA